MYQCLRVYTPISSQKNQLMRKAHRVAKIQLVFSGLPNCCSTLSLCSRSLRALFLSRSMSNVLVFQHYALQSVMTKNLCVIKSSSISGKLIELTKNEIGNCGTEPWNQRFRTGFDGTRALHCHK